MWIYVLIGAAVLLIGGVVAMLAVTYPLSKRVYFNNLVRTSPEKWGRVCSAPENEEQVSMWNSGCEWAEAHKAAMTEVSIENEGFKLYGEFYDFGSKRCVIILPGRCECLMYSYYFAQTYTKTDCNVLVIDTRSHGKSDGIYNSIGVAEKSDVKAWARYINQNFGVEEVYLHGICVGSSAGILAMSDGDCPDCIKGMITEGCFTTFRETFKRHMIVDHHPVFPVLDLVMHHIKTHTGARAVKDSPIRHVRRLNQRMLFIFGEKDLFSLPEKSKELFEACSSPDKHIVWFAKGGHSHLRINNTDEYDQAIIDFLDK